MNAGCGNIFKVMGLPDTKSYLDFVGRYSYRVASRLGGADGTKDVVFLSSSNEDIFIESQHLPTIDQDEMNADDIPFGRTSAISEERRAFVIMFLYRGAVWLMNILYRDSF
jgi:hypothetical protein